MAWRAWTIAIVAVASTPAGCASESLAPAPLAAGAGGETGGSGAGGGGGQGGGYKRTVVVRNPYGAIGKSDNLLWDGDFEWMHSFSDQYPWLTGTSPKLLGYTLPKLVIGAKCRSGIKCAQLSGDGILIGLGVAAKGKSLAAELYASGISNCSAIDVALVTQSDLEDAVALMPDAKTPSEGWCRYAATVPERAAAVWLYVHNGGSAPAVIDDASIQPVAAKNGRAFSPPLDRDFAPLRRQIAERMRDGSRPRAKDEQQFIDELERRRAR
jgi:hypothetical protein